MITEDAQQKEDKTIERRFQLATLDYKRLGDYEQKLMEKRGMYRKELFTIVGIPVAAVGALGLQSAVYLLALVPVLLTCIALEVKHDEQVLRYDVRKQMKLLAAEWGFSNHDSKYSSQQFQVKRWWHGYYKAGRGASFLVAEVIAWLVVSWHFASMPGYGIYASIGSSLLSAFFIAVTAWCMR